MMKYGSVIEVYTNIGNDSLFHILALISSFCALRTLHFLVASSGVFVFVKSFQLALRHDS